MHAAACFCIQGQMLNKLKIIIIIKKAKSANCNYFNGTRIECFNPKKLINFCAFCKTEKKGF